MSALNGLENKTVGFGTWSSPVFRPVLRICKHSIFFVFEPLHTNGTKRSVTARQRWHYSGLSQKPFRDDPTGPFFVPHNATE